MFLRIYICFWIWMFLFCQRRLSCTTLCAGRSLGLIFLRSRGRKQTLYIFTPLLSSTQAQLNKPKQLSSSVARRHIYVNSLFTWLCNGMHFSIYVMHEIIFLYISIFCMYANLLYFMNLYTRLSFVIYLCTYLMTLIKYFCLYIVLSFWILLRRGSDLIFNQEPEVFLNSTILFSFSYIHHLYTILSISIPYFNKKSQLPVNTGNRP